MINKASTSAGTQGGMKVAALPVSVLSTSSAPLGKGVPPPVPPNKPAMSALYKPLTAALKLGGVVGNSSSDNGIASISGDQQK